MINIFRKKIEPVTTTEEQVEAEVIASVTDEVEETKAEIITHEKIHNDFYTEADRILQESESHKKDLLPNEEFEKLKKLRKLGFTNVPNIEPFYKDDLKRHHIKEGKKLAEAIEYFSQKYPTKRLITKEGIDKICKKYSLIYGKVSQFIGEIPKKNVDEIVNFNVDKEDLIYKSSSWSSGSSYKYLKESKQFEFNEDMSIYAHDDIYKPFSLMIAATQKDFKLTFEQLTRIDKLSKEGIYEIPEVLDPVVFQPVMFENTEYFLIVSAWGPEAGDIEVINPLNN